MTLGVSHPRNIPTVLELAALVNPASILDIGCGAGTYGPLMRAAFPDALIIGLEGWQGNRHAMWAAYDDVLVGDVMGYPYFVTPMSLYLLVDVIEHLTCEDGLTLLRRLPAPAIIVTPRDWPQGPDENPYHEHKSVWSEADFGFAADKSDAEFVIGLKGAVL